jgi:hypothetical protein
MPGSGQLPFLPRWGATRRHAVMSGFQPMWPTAQMDALRLETMKDPHRNFKGGDMAKCETCGNDYDKSFEVVMEGRTHTFDSFECAIYTLAPACAHCGVRIVGHGA